MVIAFSFFFSIYLFFHISCLPFLLTFSSVPITHFDLLRFMCVSLCVSLCVCVCVCVCGVFYRFVLCVFIIFFYYPCVRRVVRAHVVCLVF